MSSIDYLHSENDNSINSAREVVPHLMKEFMPNSVIDVGCGLGGWLKIFEEMGIKTLMGIDGVKAHSTKLYISPDKIVQHNLEKGFSTDQRFDLAICLEAAEHIDPKHKATLVKTLISLSDRIIFSAAIPFQGGYQHKNEQWPEYWQEVFRPYGYEFIDVLRPIFWNNPRVKWWYKQNMFLVTRLPTSNTIENHMAMLRIVHPDNYCGKARMLEDIMSGKCGIKLASNIFYRAILRKLGIM